jgi:hypothetical protein
MTCWRSFSLEERLRRLKRYEDLLVVVLEVEKVLGKFWEMPYEPLKEE